MSVGGVRGRSWWVVTKTAAAAAALPRPDRRPVNDTDGKINVKDRPDSRPTGT